MLMHPVDTEREREFVEIHVAGLLDCTVQSDSAVTVLLPVTKSALAARQSEPAGTPRFSSCVADAAFESSERHERLYRRPRRILSVECTIEQRAIGGALQISVRFEVDPMSKQVGIEPRVAGHGEHRTGHRIDGHNRAILIAECQFGGTLQTYVHREEQVPAGNWIMALQHTQNAPLGIGLHTLITHFAVQLILIGRFDASLADVRRSAVVGLIDTIELALVDATDIADEMDAEFAERVVSRQPRADIDSGESMPVDRKSGDLSVIQPQA